MRLAGPAAQWEFTTPAAVLQGAWRVTLVVDVAHAATPLELGRTPPADCLPGGPCSARFAVDRVDTSGLPAGAVNNAALLSVALVDGAGARRALFALLVQVVKTPAGYTRTLVAPTLGPMELGG